MAGKPLHTTVDANLLAPRLTRTIIFGLAEKDIIFPRISLRILHEAMHALRRFEKLDPSGSVRSLHACFESAKGWLVDPSCFEHLTLPDPRDRHVLQTAITAGAPLILTENLRDFPNKVLEPLGIRKSALDPFMIYLTETWPDEIARILQNTHAGLTELAGQELDFCEALRRSNLRKLSVWWARQLVLDDEDIAEPQNGQHGNP